MWVKEPQDCPGGGFPVTSDEKRTPKHNAMLQIRLLRFSSLFSRMSLARNRLPLWGDML
jgi:hypothetical protein